MASSSSSSEQERFKGCYETWIRLQQQDLEELVHESARYANDSDRLACLVTKNMQQYQDYADQRKVLPKEDPPSFFCPTWCTSFENSYLWIAGCRPSMSIRLVYALGGFAAGLAAGARRGNLAELSARQLESINKLHLTTVREEDKLSNRMASLQESVVDHPLVKIASQRDSDGESDCAIQSHADALATLLVDADQLRVRTVRNLVDILTPLQAVDFLIAAKQIDRTAKDIVIEDKENIAVEEGNTEVNSRRIRRKLNWTNDYVM